METPHYMRRYYEEHREITERQLNYIKLQLSKLAIKESGQLELDYEEI